MDKLLSANSSKDSPDDIENEELTNTDDVGEDPEEPSNDSEINVEKERWTDAGDVKDDSAKHSDDLGDDRKRGQRYSLRGRATRKPPVWLKMVKFGMNNVPGEGVMKYS